MEDLAKLFEGYRKHLRRGRALDWRIVEGVGKAWSWLRLGALVLILGMALLWTLSSVLGRGSLGL